MCLSLKGLIFKGVAAAAIAAFIQAATLQSHALAAEVTHDIALTSVAGLTPNLTTIAETTFLGKRAVSVDLTEAEQKRQIISAGTIDNGPTFALLDVDFSNGTIEVDIAGRVNGKGIPDARGFVGLAFHIAPDLSSFNGVYLRMTNGSKNNPLPPAPRLDKAIQYFSFPDRPWRKLRKEFPGRYESSAPVAEGQWHRLRLDIQAETVTAFVDAQKVLEVKDMSFPDRKGRIGLWIDDGSTGYFANLRVVKK